MKSDSFDVSYDMPVQGRKDHMSGVGGWGVGDAVSASFNAINVNNDMVDIGSNLPENQYGGKDAASTEKERYRQDHEKIREERRIADHSERIIDHSHDHSIGDGYGVGSPADNRTMGGSGGTRGGGHDPSGSHGGQTWGGPPANTLPQAPAGSGGGSSPLSVKGRKRRGSQRSAGTGTVGGTGVIGGGAGGTNTPSGGGIQSTPSP